MKTKAVCLINSAAYVDSEMAAEFGRLPPCFLPFGHGRLYEAQIASLAAHDARIVLTLPASFVPDPADLGWLNRRSVEVLHVPDGLSLGQSIAHALALTEAGGQVSMLHGDTLFSPPPPPGVGNLVGVATTGDAYNWGAVKTGVLPGFDQRTVTEEEGEKVLTGWFSLSSAPAFLRSLTLARGDFLEALEIYAAGHPLTFLDMPGWLDFGHLQTFYRSRTKVSTARSFNSLAIAEQSVAKSGEKSAKLDAEAAWFENLPAPLRLYAPAFLGRENGGYRIAYEFNPTLHELFVFGRLEAPTWRRILTACFKFLEECRAYGGDAPDDAAVTLSIGKTMSRLEDWAKTSGLDLTAEWKLNGQRLPSLVDIAENTARRLAHREGVLGVMHGDFCFPNAFFDFRRGTVKVIDPRGSVVDGTPSIHGDVRYDLAKLNHSIEGYDLILAGRADVSFGSAYEATFRLPNDGAASFLPAIAAEFELAGYRLNDPAIMALTVNLFLSMLPLHADRPDRQKAFLANALRLYKKLEDAA